MVMKRIFSITSATICSLLLVFSCNKPGTDPTPDPSINIDSPTILVAAGDNTAVLTFTSNNDWSVSSSESWCTVSPASGSASENATAVTITLEPNTTGETRSTTITVKAGGIEKQVTVTQAPEEVKPEDIIIQYIWNSQDDTQITTREITTGYRGPYGDTDIRKLSSYTAVVSVDFDNPDLDIMPEADAQGWIIRRYSIYYDSYSGTWQVPFVVYANPNNEPRTGHLRVVSNGGQYVSGLITVVQEALPEHAIDIGMDYYWHEFNLGASAPEEPGDYYAWGELAPKTTYNWDTYNCAGGDMYSTIENYPGGGYSYRSSLSPEHDAASNVLGYSGWIGGDDVKARWQMPSRYQFEELIATRSQTDTYKWEWQTIGGHGGWKITYLVNGNYIFLPAGGYTWDVALEHPELGLYWSLDALFENEWTSSVKPTNKSYYLRFESGQSGEVAVYSDGVRAAGKPIRPVTY